MRIEAQWLVPATQPVVTAGAYVSGQCVGSKLTFDLSGFRPTTGLILQSLALVDQAKQSALMDLLLFDSDPSATTFTDNTTLDVADADMIKLIGVAPITTYATFNDNGFAYSAGLSIPIQGLPSAGATLYAALVSRGTPTFAATTDVSLRLGFVML